MIIETGIHHVTGLKVEPITHRICELSGNDYTVRHLKIKTETGEYTITLFGDTADQLTINEE